MPRWLEPVVPHLSIEGAEFFQELDGEDRKGAPAVTGTYL